MSKVDSEKPVKNGFFEKVLDMDYRKATKYIMKGLIVAILFGTVLMTSKTIATNAQDWEDVQDQQNKMNYWNGEYGLQEYNERSEEIELKSFWMEYQEVIVGNIARAGVNLALFVVVIGFLGYSADKEVDEQKRRLSFILAGVIVFIMMFTTFFSNIAINLS